MKAYFCSVNGKISIGMLIWRIERGNGEVISRGEAECNLAISECNYIQNCAKSMKLPINHILHIMLTDISG